MRKNEGGREEGRRVDGEDQLCNGRSAGGSFHISQISPNPANANG